MTDQPDLRGTPGYDSAMKTFNVGTKSLQSFASEVQRMSKESFENTTQLMEKLRSAKTMEDVVSVQTSFMQQSFTLSAEYTRRFSELMMSLPFEMARNSRDAVQQSTDALKRAGEQAGTEMQKASEQFTHHNG